MNNELVNNLTTVLDNLKEKLGDLLLKLCIVEFILIVFMAILNISQNVFAPNVSLLMNLIGGK